MAGEDAADAIDVDGDYPAIVDAEAAHGGDDGLDCSGRDRLLLAHRSAVVVSTTDVLNRQDRHLLHWLALRVTRHRFCHRHEGAASDRVVAPALDLVAASAQIAKDGERLKLHVRVELVMDHRVID